MNISNLWNAYPVPSFLIDRGGCVLSINPAAESLLNSSQKSVKGKSCGDVIQAGLDFAGLFSRIHHDQNDININDITVAIDQKTALMCNIQIAMMDQEQVLVLVLPRKNIGRGGMAVGSAAKSAIGMAEMLAHEIKNPLAGITGAAQLLEMNLSAQDTEMTDLIVSEAKRIVKLLDQVEQFGNVSLPTLKSVNIHDIVDRARMSAAVGFASHVTLIEEYDPSLPDTYVDPDQFMQVILNLLKNAAEALPDTHGEIRIRTFYEQGLRLRRDGQQTAFLPLQVEIIDNGPGLPADIARNVFDPFVSGRENGTGLGLALVSKIITDHNAWITIDSQPGRCAFRISLPIAPKSKD